MLPVTRLTPRFAVAGVLAATDYEAAKRAGFTGIVNFLPDDEPRGQLSAARAQQAAEEAGLTYRYIPTSKLDLFTDETVGQAADAFDRSRGNILAVCASGQRAAIVWAATAARSTPVDDVLQTLKVAGFALDFIRDDLEAQADRERWSVVTQTSETSDLASAALTEAA